MIQPKYYIEILRYDGLLEIVMVHRETVNKVYGYIVFSEYDIKRVGNFWSCYSNFDSGNFEQAISSEAHSMWPMYVKDWWKAINRRRRYMFVAETYEGGLGLGEQGSKYLPTNDPTLEPHFDSNGNLKTTTLPTTPAPGIRSDGVYSGYNDVPYGATTDANGYVGSVAPNPPGS